MTIICIVMKDGCMTVYGCMTASVPLAVMRDKYVATSDINPTATWLGKLINPNKVIRSKSC